MSLFPEITNINTIESSNLECLHLFALQIEFVARLSNVTLIDEQLGDALFESCLAHVPRLPLGRCLLLPRGQLKCGTVPDYSTLTFN